MIAIEFSGKAIPQGRMRYTHTGHTYTPPKTAQFRKEFAEAARSQYQGAPLAGAVRLFVLISLAPPKSLSQKKQREMIGKPIYKKPDIDNLAKSIMDALTGITWEDDNQVAELYILKAYGKEDKVEVYIDELEVIEI